MSIKLLVLHGPNVPLRLEREESLSLSGLHRTLNQQARALGATLRFVHAHGEEGLTAALWEQRRWAEGLLLAAGTASDSAVLREALEVLALPTVELLLGAEAPRKREGRPGLVQVSGRGEAAYREGLERLSERVAGTASPRSNAAEKSRSETAETSSSKTGETSSSKTGERLGSTAARKKVGPTPAIPGPSGRAAKTLGRAASVTSVAPPTREVTARGRGAAGTASSEAPSTGRQAKTVGRRKAEAAPRTGKSLGRRGAGEIRSASAGNTDPTRAEARSQLAARLSGALTPAELGAWARRGWARLEADSARDPQLADVLLALVATPKVTDERLLELMAELGS